MEFSALRRHGRSYPRDTALRPLHDSRATAQRSCSVLLCVVLLVSTGNDGAAQAPTAAITGIVRDSSAAVLNQTEIVARSLEMGFEYRARTSSTGRYWLRALPPGAYDVTARRIGFRAATRRQVTLALGQTVTLDFTLPRTAVELAPIEVVADIPLIETTQSDVSFVLHRNEIARLPEESRRFIDLAQLAPGATAASNAGALTRGGPTVSVGGLNTQSMGVVADGGDLTESLFGELSGGIPLLAVQEFEVIQTQYSTQFGRAASGTVNIATRRGTNELAFEAFGLYRHRSLNALGEFESEKPGFNRSHWGIAVGGPVVRNRTHFFVAVERKVQNDFSTVETGGAFPTFEGTFKTPTTDNLLFGRVDHRINDSHELTLRYTGEIRDALSGVGGSSALEHGTNESIDMHSVLLTHRWVLGGSLLNEARVHVSRREFATKPNAPAGPQLCYLSICIGPNAGTAGASTTRIELKDDLSLVSAGASGTHRFRFGTHLSWQNNDVELALCRRGCFIFRSDNVTDLPGAVLVSDRTAVGLDARNLQIAIYAQDDWNPHPNLTLKLGLRYDIETNGTNQGFVSPFAGALPFIRTTPRPSDKNNIAPRVGFAWDLVGDGRTVVRGGLGIFYDKFIAYPLLALERSSGPGATFIPNPGTTNVDDLTIDFDNVPPILLPGASEMKSPMTRQFSLGVERVLPHDIVVRVDGSYSQGRNLLIQRSLNTFDPATGPKYPQFGLILQVLTAGEADSKMLLFNARKSFSQGWLDVSYTLADRQITNDNWSSDVQGPLDPDVDDFSSELGPAAWDERHRLIVTGGLELPFELSAAVKTIYSSARPYTALTTMDDVNADGDFLDRLRGEGRNARRGPDFFRTDIGIRWTIPTRGPQQIALVANVYNIFNTTNLDPESVIGVLEAQLFGQAVAAFPKRQGEVGVQVAF